jgi:hypothetical protein
LKTTLAFLQKNKGKIAAGFGVAAVAANYFAGTVDLNTALGAVLQVLTAQ